MTKPELADLEKVVATLSDDVASTDAGQAAIWQVRGRPTAGKSVVLHELTERLDEAGYWPILAAPPPAQLDTAAAVLVDVAVQLEQRGLVNGSMSVLKTAETPWVDKYAVVESLLEQNAEQLVILCDEPGSWAPRISDLDRFASHARDVVRLLVHNTKCKRIVAGDLPESLRPKGVEYLSGSYASGDWLEDASSWGRLDVYAAQLGEAAEISGYSPLEARLLVALAAITSIEEVVDWLVERPVRRAIAARLEGVIDGSPRHAMLRETWKRLALVRRTITPEILERLTPKKLSEYAGDIVRNCLLYRRNGSYVLHDTLRRDAHSRWIAPNDRIDTKWLRRMSRALVEAYADSVSQAGGEDAPTALPDAMEVRHYLSTAGDMALLEEFPPFFIEQLDALGRSLSYDYRDYEGAVKVFELAAELDDDDAYAHHYLAFNLDRLAREPERVEKEYLRAIELTPAHVWRRSRYIMFLIIRGRTADALSAWNEALDVLTSPEGDDDNFLFDTLHLWVVRPLLQRGQLDFAQLVLASVPEWAFDANPALAEAAERLAALKEARRLGAFVPANYLVPGWWREGPVKLQSRLGTGERLVRWLAAKVEAVEASEINLRGAEVQGDSEPREFRTTMSFDQFDRWCRDDTMSDDLKAGRFLEIGLYVKNGRAKGASPITIIRVHKDHAWDAGLGGQKDSARYLVSA